MPPNWDSVPEIPPRPPAPLPPRPLPRAFPPGRPAYGKRQKLMRGGERGAAVRRSPYFRTAEGGRRQSAGRERCCQGGAARASSGLPLPPGTGGCAPRPASCGGSGAGRPDGGRRGGWQGAGPVRDGRPRSPATASEYRGGQKNAPVPRGPRGPGRAGECAGPAGRRPAGLRDPPEHGRSGAEGADARGPRGCGGRVGRARRAEASRGTGPSLAPRWAPATYRATPAATRDPSVPSRSC